MKNEYKGICWCGHAKKSHNRKGECKAKKSKTNNVTSCNCMRYGKFNRFAKSKEGVIE